ncbi:MAG TPA: cysteine desulfurase family protein [Dongiaceae bacterium]|jgi:cysteine desulfurase
MQRRIYMDWNATAPLRPAARHALVTATEICGNPSSVHGFGRDARRLIDQSRAQLAALLGAKVQDVVFTSGGTEANALMLANRGARRLIVSAIEHDSILKPALATGASVIRVDRNGVIDLDHLRTLLMESGEPALVSVMLANNETGVIQPVAEAARLAHEFGAQFHCDASQAIGRIPVDLAALGADYLSISGHKFGAPLGVGALVLNSAALGHHEIAPLLQGGGQERNRRAGTENAPAIAGLGAAVGELDSGEAEKVSALRALLEKRLLAVTPEACILGIEAPRLPNTICIATGTKPSETQVMAFDLAGIAVSAGSACSSGKVKPSHVVSAMGFDAATAARSVRISLGWGNIPADIDAFVAAWTHIQSGDRQIQPAA